MSTKQKTVHDRGPSNINLVIFVCSYEVCRVSQPVPSNNYVHSKLRFSPAVHCRDNGHYPLLFFTCGFPCYRITIDLCLNARFLVRAIKIFSMLRSCPPKFFRHPISEFSGSAIQPKCVSTKQKDNSLCPTSGLSPEY